MGVMYKANDTVIIVDKRTDYMNSDGEMDHWLGKVMHIAEVIEHSYFPYVMCEDSRENGGFGWGWNDDMIDHEKTEQQYGKINAPKPKKVQKEVIEEKKTVSSMTDIDLYKRREELERQQKEIAEELRQINARIEQKKIQEIEKPKTPQDLYDLIRKHGTDRIKQCIKCSFCPIKDEKCFRGSSCSDFEYLRCEEILKLFYEGYNKPSYGQIASRNFEIQGAMDTIRKQYNRKPKEPKDM